MTAPHKLRRDLMLLMLPYCLEQAWKSYHHVCDATSREVVRKAYEAADEMLSEIGKTP